VCFVSIAGAEKMKITGHNKSERVISQNTIDPGDSPGHVMMQSVTMNKTTSPNTDWNETMAVDYQHMDQQGVSGTHAGYGYNKHQGGDQTFYKYWGTQKAAEGGKISFEGKYEWTGGTGKFKNIKGAGTYTCTGTATESSCDWQGEFEY
jgi:hypothetical protein